MLTGAMNLHDLTVSQLKRAAAIKEQIEALNKELGGLLGMPAKTGAVTKKKRTMSASVKKKIAAAQKARWASVQGAKPSARAAAPAAKAKKKQVSQATRAKLRAKLKAFWAAKRAAAKK
jgi:hypothetical protein